MESRPPRSGAAAFATATAVAVFAATLTWLFARTLDAWGVAHDAGNQFYVVSILDRGGVLYRDVFELNWPGNFVVHRALAALGADGDRAWRLVDLGLVAASAEIVAWIAAPAGRLAALVAAVVVGAIHLLGGPWNIGQRDHFMSVCVLLAAALASRGSVHAFAAGLAIGAAAGFKPFALAFLAAIPWLAAGRRVRASAAAVAGAGAVLAALVLDLAWRGNLADFVAGQRFAANAYATVARRAPAEVFDFVARDFLPLLPLAAAAIVGLAASPSGAGRATLAARALVAYGLFHFLIQSKGWTYHAYPLLDALALATGLGAARLAAGSAPARWSVAPALLLAALLTTARTFDRTAQPPESLAPAIVAELGPRLSPGDRVQGLDATYGVNDALRRLGVPPATPFLYDFLFFAGDDASNTVMRARFLAALEAAPPRAFVVSNQQWPEPRRGFERLARWPELVAFLDARYQLVAEGEVHRGWAGYRIYIRRDG